MLEDKETLSKIKALMANNSREEGSNLYTVPSPITYPYQWLWDSCFHSIIYSYFDLKKAKDEIHSLLSKQFPNGMVPHMIYWKRGPVIDIDWGSGKETSTITQPPMIAYSAWHIFKKDGDIEFLRSIYINLFHYYRYLINERDPHKRHLLGIINPDESGEDNSPRFDALLGLPPRHSIEENLNKRIELVKENIKCKFDAPFCMKNLFWVKDVPFNSIMVENLQCLVYIAEKIERGHDAKYFQDERGVMIKSMKELMVEDGLYWSTYGENYQKIKVKTWAIFMPLFARILSKEEAESLVRSYLLNSEEFWNKYGVATVSKKEISYNPSDMWRGPSWIAVNWFIYRGLLNYGLNDIAQKIKVSTVNLLAKQGFREYYNGETGDGLGAESFTWGGLVVDMEETSNKELKSQTNVKQRDVL